MKLPKNRWEAFATHFGISLLIFFALLGVIIFLWYPGALFTAAGGWQGIRIVVGVHLVLGPLPTLIVYNLAKPLRLLYRDLLIVGVIQLGCLAAGVYIVYAERPVAVVYYLDKFYALKRSEFVANGKDPDSLSLRVMTPAYFRVELKAVSQEEAELIRKINMFMGKDQLFRTDLYRPLYRTLPEAKNLLSLNPQLQAPGYPERCLAAQLVTAYAEGSVCFDPSQQSLEKFIPKN